jgi:cation-transporting ATPase 13A3/4/5
MSEVFHPFFVFQMYSVILWSFEEYYIFAGCIAFIASISIITTLMETRSRLTNLSKLAKYEAPVEVLRNNVFITLSSTQLVPGDIVRITTGIVPCDISLLNGGCVVNESMLTGEAVPVIKTHIQWPIHISDQLLSIGTENRSTLFAATKVLQLKPGTPGANVLGTVVRTGFATTKGELILSILYPQPSSFKFVEQSYKFVFFLFCLSLIGFGISIWQLRRVGADDAIMIIRALDLITIVVPPTLPLALSVGTNFALIALRKEWIFCISPARINMAGKVRLMCFDKTGTLTSGKEKI